MRKQIGMAVPPKGAEVVLRALLNSIAGIEYPAIPPNITATENSKEHFYANTGALQFGTGSWQNLRSRL